MRGPSRNTNPGGPSRLGSSFSSPLPTGRSPTSDSVACRCRSTRTCMPQMCAFVASFFAARCSSPAPDQRAPTSAVASPIRRLCLRSLGCGLYGIRDQALPSPHGSDTIACTRTIIGRPAAAKQSSSSAARSIPTRNPKATATTRSPRRHQDGGVAVVGLAAAQPAHQPGVTEAEQKQGQQDDDSDEVNIELIASCLSVHHLPFE